MSEKFDPYHTWLGIPLDEQPPNYYRLLGISPFESDSEVIQNACDQRMAHLKAFATGPQAMLSERLLNEVSKATVCLLNLSKKRTYDDALRAAIGQTTRPKAMEAVRPRSATPDIPHMPGPASDPQIPQQSAVIRVSALPSVSSQMRRRRYSCKTNQRLTVLAVQLLVTGVVGLAAGCFILWLVYPNHPIIAFIERTVRPREPSPGKPEQQPSENSRELDKTPARNRDVEPPEDNGKAARLIPMPSTPAQPWVEPSNESLEGTAPRKQADDEPQVPTSIRYNKEVSLNLAKSSTYEALTEVPNAKEAQVRIERIAGIAAPYDLVPPDGVVRQGQPVDIVFVQHARVTLRIEMDTVAAVTRLRVTARIDDEASGKTIQFTQRWISQQASESRQLVESLQQNLWAAQGEYAAIETWLATPGPKPLELRAQRRQRLQWLHGAIPVLQQKAREAETRAEHFGRLVELANQLHDNARVHLAVIVESHKVEPQPVADAPRD